MMNIDIARTDVVQVSIEPSKEEGQYTLRLENEFGKKYALSKYRPKQDDINKISFKDVEKETVWVFFGYCLGYAIEHVMRQIGDESRFIIIEPDKECLIEQLKLTKDRIIQVAEEARMVQDIQMEFVSGEECLNIKNHIKKLMPGTPVKLMVNEVYAEYYPNYLREVIKQIKDGNMESIMNTNTIKQFSEQFLVNTLKNRSALVESNDIRKYKDFYHDIPAIIVSAGPSLEKNISLIKDFKGIIFTGGRTLQNVMEQGVRPHFLVSIDPGEAAYNVLRDYQENDIPLIAPMCTHYKVVGMNTGPKFMIEINNPKYSDLMFGTNMPYASIGGSVATLCLERAYYMGCNPIIFIGQDLAYTNNQYHANTASLVQGEKINENEVGLQVVEGYDGGEVCTNPQLKSFLVWMETFIENHKDRKYINCTEGGAKIRGTEQESLKEYIKKDKDNYIIRQDYKRLIDKSIEEVEEEVDELIVLLETGVKFAREGKVLADKLESEYSVHKGVRTGKVNRILEAFDVEVDVKLHKVTKIIKSVLDVEVIDIEQSGKYATPFKETLLEQGIRVARKNKAIYSAIENAINHVIKIIKENR